MTFSFREKYYEDQTSLEPESENEPGWGQLGGGPCQSQAGGAEEEGRVRDKEPQICSEVLQTSNFLLSLQRFHLVRQFLLTNLGSFGSFDSNISRMSVLQNTNNFLNNDPALIQLENKGRKCP